MKKKIEKITLETFSDINQKLESGEFDEERAFGSAVFRICMKVNEIIEVLNKNK